MVCNHNVLVARACLDSELSRVIRIKFAERQDIEIEFVGCNQRSGWLD